MQNIIYLDNAATTKVKEDVVKNMIPYFTEEYGNPSSVYSIARRNKKVIENAREKVAKLINANKNEIYFTSGGSESDNMAIKGIAYANKYKGNHIITSKIEHHAVLETCEFLETQGFEITYLNVDENGVVNLEELERSIKDKTILISIMFANNEIGTIEPIEKISRIARYNNIIFHTDAVQAVGNIKIDVKKMGIDMLSMSGHKIYGPKGIGALYIKNDLNLIKFINGGGQEKNRRAGTENVSGIVGLGKACELAGMNIDEHVNNISFLRDYYEQKVKNIMTDIKINGYVENRLPGNSNISFKNIDGSALLLELDNRGICASSASACSAGDIKPSHVLTSIGLKEEWSKGALRVSLGEFNNKSEVDYMVECLKEIIKKLSNNKINN